MFVSKFVKLFVPFLAAIVATVDGRPTILESAVDLYQEELRTLADAIRSRETKMIEDQKRSPPPNQLQHNGGGGGGGSQVGGGQDFGQEPPQVYNANPYDIVEIRFMEHEDWASQAQQKYDNLQYYTARQTGAQNVHDTNSQNDLKKQPGSDAHEVVKGADRSIVNGYELLSTMMNLLADLPSRAFERLQNTVVESLDRVGSRIIGLER